MAEDTRGDLAEEFQFLFGELVDRLSITNIQIARLESPLRDRVGLPDEETARLAREIRDKNKQRVDLRNALQRLWDSRPERANFLQAQFQAACTHTLHEDVLAEQRFYNFSMLNSVFILALTIAYMVRTFWLGWVAVVPALVVNAVWAFTGKRIDLAMTFWKGVRLKLERELAEVHGTNDATQAFEYRRRAYSGTPVTIVFPDGSSRDFAVPLRSRFAVSLLQHRLTPWLMIAFWFGCALFLTLGTPRSAG